MRVLSKSDVQQAVSIGEVMAVVEHAQMLYGTGDTVSSPIYSLFAGADPAKLPEIRGNFQFFSAYLGGDLGVEGITSTASCVNNPTMFGLPYALGLQIINDVANGVPLAVMERSRITELVTPSVSAVGAKYLARQDTATVAIIGCGNQGRNHLLAFNELFDIHAVRAYDIRADVLDRYIADMQQETGLPIDAAESEEQAIRAADLTSIAINPVELRVKYDWIKPGALLVALSGGGSELDTEDIYPRIDRLVVDCWANYGSLQDRSGITAPVQLGEIVAGRRPGRRDDAERIVLVHSGMAVNHVAAGHLIYERAQEKNLGLEFDLF